MLHAYIQVLLQPLIARVHDLVDGKRCKPRVRMPDLHVGQFFAYAREPYVEHLIGPGIQRRKTPDAAGRTLSEHEHGPADEEHRCADDRQTQAIAQWRRH